MNEVDPNGISQHEPGAKLDHGKVQMGLVFGGFARSLEEVGKVATYGANKYTPDGWKHVPNPVERYTNAMLRHWVAYSKGEVLDKDTGLSHFAHFTWNALAVLHFLSGHD